MLNADVHTWLDSIGLGQYAELFDHEAITMDVLVDLNENDLKSLSIPLGHRKQILKGIAEHQRQAERKAERLERRQLTIVFSDLVGSTALSNQLDAEELRDILRGYQEVCRNTIEARGGIIARYQGDGVLAYFGYPQADEDSVVNAVRGGLEIVERVVDRFETRYQTRVGVATGTVVVGDIIGEGHSRESPVVGKTPNLAARLQSFAEPNQVVISNASRELVQAYLECDDLGRHELKGFEEPERIWLAIGDRKASSRFAAQVDHRGLRPLMGRADELTKIRDIWSDVLGGHRHCLQLVGEAGAGKSRLLHALLDEVVTGPAWVAQCQPDRMSTALYPFASLLRDQVLKIKVDADVSKTYQSIDNLLQARNLLTEENRAIFGGAIGLPPPAGQTPLGSSPERQREASLQLLTTVLTSVQPGEAGCLIVEDAHWLDPTSRELVEKICRDEAGPLALVLVTSREELEFSGLQKLSLVGLAADAAAEIVRNLSARIELPDVLVAQIIEKTDGNPFFIEEMTRAVLRALETDTGEPETLLSRLEVPMSLRDSLAARLDSLDLELRDLLQLGAVIGREFGADILKAAAENETWTIDRRLADLVEREFLVTEDGEAFSFHHALLQDAAYSGLLHSRRRELHARVAMKLESDFPAVVASEPETLARHYTAAERVQAAIPYWQAAGEAAGHRSASQEAVSHLRQCLDLLALAPESPERDMAELAAQVTMGPSLMAVHGYTSQPVQAAYARARELCERFGDAPETVPVLFGMWIHYGAQGALQASLDLAEQLNRIASTTGDPGLMLATNLSLGCSLYHMGQFQRSRKHQDHVLQLYDPERDGEQCYVYGQDPYAASCVYSSSLYWCLGFVDRGRELAERGIAVARELEHPYTLALSLVFAARFNTKLGDFAAVRSLTEEAIAIAGKHGFPTWESFAKILLGHAQARTDSSMEPGVSLMREAMAVSRQFGQGLSLAWFESLLGGLLLEAGDYAGAGQALDSANREIDRFGEQAESCEVKRLEGQLGIANGDDETAIAHLKTGVKLARAQNAPSWELRLLNDLQRFAGGCETELADCLSRIECVHPTVDIDLARGFLAS